MNLNLNLNLMRSYIIACFFIFLISCISDQSNSINISIGDQCDQVEEGDVIISNAFQISGGKDFFIGSVDKVIQFQNKYIILDCMDKKVVILNEDGILETIIRRVGLGPYEYQDVSDMCVTESTIAIFDDKGGQILEFDIEGNPVSAFKIHTHNGYFGYLNDHFVISKSRYVSAGSSPDFHRVTVFDRVGDQTSGYLSFKTPFQSWLSYGNEVVPYKGGVLLNQTFDYNIYYLDRSLKFQTLLSVNFGDKSIDTIGINDLSGVEEVKSHKTNRGKILSIGNLYGIQAGIVSWTTYKGHGYLTLLDQKKGISKTYQASNYKILGYQNNFPIPRPRGDNGKELIGCLEPVQLIDFDLDISAKLKSGDDFFIKNRDMQVIVIYSIK